MSDLSARDLAVPTRDLALPTPETTMTPSLGAVGARTVFATVVPDSPTSDTGVAGDAGGAAESPAAPAAPEPPAPPGPPARPRVRWGALVWSLLFAATAALTLWYLDPDRREAAGAWLLALEPLAAGLYALLVVGALIAIFGLVGLVRRGERARRR